MAERLSEIKGASFITLKFYDETSKEVLEVIEKYKNHAPAPKYGFTRGLYYRGIL